MKNFFIIIVCIFCLCNIYAQNKEKTPSPATEKEFLNDIHRYVKLFGSKNALFSLNSLDYIEYFGYKAVPALIKGLENSDAQIRCLSSFALSRVPDLRSIGPLIELLKDKRGVNFNILSDDGMSMHHAYGSPIYTVRNVALISLHTITKKNFGYFLKDPDENQVLVENWRKWWKQAKTSFKVPPKNIYSNTINRYHIPDYAKLLKGITVCIDPGHGGLAYKIGYKRGPTGNREAESNLKVSRYLKDFLLKCKAKVIMTRDSDKFVSLKARPTIAKLYGADIFISIHHNWTPRYTAQATTIWYHMTPDYNPSSIDLARYIFQEVTNKVEMKELDKSMGLKSDNLIYDIGFSVLRNLDSSIVGTLCELAFFSNLETELKMRNSGFLKKEAYGIFLGIARYIYAGIPHYKVISPKTKDIEDEKPNFTVRIFDGLESRKEWGWKRIKIFVRNLVVELDGKKTHFKYDRTKGILTFTPLSPLKSGKHKLSIFIININKNNNWKPHYYFTIK